MKRGDVRPRPEPQAASIRPGGRSAPAQTKSTGKRQNRATASPPSAAFRAAPTSGEAGCPWKKYPPLDAAGGDPGNASRALDGGVSCGRPSGLFFIRGSGMTFSTGSWGAPEFFLRFLDSRESSIGQSRLRALSAHGRLRRQWLPPRDAWASGSVGQRRDLSGIWQTGGKENSLGYERPLTADSAVERCLVGDVAGCVVDCGGIGLAVEVAGRPRRSFLQRPPGSGAGRELVAGGGCRRGGRGRHDPDCGRTRTAVAAVSPQALSRGAQRGKAQAHGWSAPRLTGHRSSFLRCLDAACSRSTGANDGLESGSNGTTFSLSGAWRLWRDDQSSL